MVVFAGIITVALHGLCVCVTDCTATITEPAQVGGAKIVRNGSWKPIGKTTNTTARIAFQMNGWKISNNDPKRQ
jgi:hypothetical protein